MQLPRRRRRPQEGQGRQHLRVRRPGQEDRHRVLRRKHHRHERHRRHHHRRHHLRRRSPRAPALCEDLRPHHGDDLLHQRLPLLRPGGQVRHLPPDPGPPLPGDPEGRVPPDHGDRGRHGRQAMRLPVFRRLRSPL